MLFGLRPSMTNISEAVYLTAVWPETCGLMCGRFSAKLGPQSPAKSAGLVLHCRLCQNSITQTSSKAISWSKKPRPACLQVARLFKHILLF